MEKVTTKLEIKNNGKVVGEKTVLAGWKFDSDEREALENILKDKFDNKQIDTYLTMLEWICFQMKIWDEELPSYKEVKLYAEPILNSIKKTTDYLSLLEKEQLAKGVPFGFPYFLGSDPDPLDKRHKSRYVESISKSAKASRISLEELKAQIENQLLNWEPPPNRAKADSHSLVFDMARRYYQIFYEMPTTTTEGTFFLVVARVFELLGLPSEYPQRPVINAIKKLKKQVSYLAANKKLKPHNP